MRSSTSARALPEPPRLTGLWAGLLTGPIVWLVLLQANYVLSYVACESKQTWFLHGATFAAAAIVAIVGLRTWRVGVAGRTLEPSISEPVSPQTSESRAVWMGYAGAAISAWFVIAILAMDVPIAVLNTCQ